MRYYQGDDIDFSIDIKQIAANDIQDWTFFPKVVVYFYTHPSYIAKFDREGKNGYVKMNLSSDYKKYSGEITHDQTLKMIGPLHMDIRVFDERNNISTKSIDTGIRIMQTPLKEENYE